jgi:hypothetical protein
MKNFPDHDQFDELEKRLRSYSEQPEDLIWENIDAALRPNRTLFWVRWLDYFALTILIFACVLAINAAQSNQALLTSAIVNESESLRHNHQRNQLPLKQKEQKKENGNSDIYEGTSVNPFVSREIFYNADKVELETQVNASRKAKIPPTSDTTQALSQLIHEEEIFLAMLRADTLIVPSVDMPVDSLTQNQNAAKQPKRIAKKRRPALYATVTPSLSFQHAIPLSNDEIIVNGLSDVSILSAERFGISLDVGLQGSISKRFEYYGGLSFYHQNQVLKYSFQSGDVVSVESSGDNSYTVTPKSFVGSINYEMLNLGVQAGILYNLYGKTLTHKIGAGLGYQNGFKKSNSGAYENSESGYFSYQVFYRNEVRVRPRLRFFVQPVFTQSIQVREQLDAPFNLKPYRAGIGFGILYDF